MRVTDHSSLDTQTYARRKNEGDDYWEENPTQDYVKTITKYRIGLKDNITWEMRRYDRYDMMMDTLRRMALSCVRKIDLDLTHRFSFATSALKKMLFGQIIYGAL